MVLELVLLILPAFGYCDFVIDLSVELRNVTFELKVSKTSYIGIDTGIITDKERNTFNLDDDNLKNAIKSFIGQRPDNAYLHGPTPFRDIFLIHGWQPVTRVLKPHNGRILKLSSESNVVQQQVFKNGYKIPSTYDVGISHKVKDTASSIWNPVVDLSISQLITRVIKVEIPGIDREISFNYTSPWGMHTKQLKHIRIGATSNLSIVLEPGQTVMSQLHATKGSIKFLMKYEASLIGNTAVTYDNEYKGLHTWSFNISDCMNSSGLSNSKISEEVIDVEFYIDSKILVYDQTSGKVLMEKVYLLH